MGLPLMNGGNVERRRVLGLQDFDTPAREACYAHKLWNFSMSRVGDYNLSDLHVIN